MAKCSNVHALYHADLCLRMDIAKAMYEKYTRLNMNGQI